MCYLENVKRKARQADRPERITTMKLKDILPIMNIYDITVAADSDSDLEFCGTLDATPMNRADIISQYGDREVTHITNIAKHGDTIWIK